MNTRICVSHLSFKCNPTPEASMFVVPVVVLLKGICSYSIVTINTFANVALQQQEVRSYISGWDESQVAVIRIFQ